MLSRCTVDYYSASVHATLASAGVGRNPAVRVRRDWFFLDGVHSRAPKRTSAKSRV